MKPSKTHKPIPKQRAKVRPGRLRGKALEALRIACFMRDSGNCQECGDPVFHDAPEWSGVRYHMAHIKAKRIGGDSLENVRTLCGACHRASHQFGPSMTKPVPKKEM